MAVQDRTREDECRFHDSYYISGRVSSMTSEESMARTHTHTHTHTHIHIHTLRLLLARKTQCIESGRGTRRISVQERRAVVPTIGSAPMIKQVVYYGLPPT